MKLESDPRLGSDFRKIQPKLRMIANGSETVNVMRAEHCAALSVEDPQLTQRIELTRQVGAIPVQASQLIEDLTPQTLQAVPDMVFANVFIHTIGLGEGKGVTGETARAGELRTAKVRLSELGEIARLPGVNYIEIGQPLCAPTPEVANGSPAPPNEELRRIAGAELHRDGQEVLIGIIDCGGFDFAHPDFLDENGQTRWFKIWDQGGKVHPAPAPFSYGSELTQQQMNDAIKAARGASLGKGLPATELEPQSQMQVGSHGTHVASIAAGNRGVCRKARLAGVLIGLDKVEADPRKSFYDSTCLAHAVEYLVGVAKQLSKDPDKPVPLSINISLGTNGHAHDGSVAISRWIDSILSVPGRGVSVSAGNCGQEAPEYDGDIGWVMGRIHTSGKISAKGLYKDIEWVVAGNGVADISENELEIWYSAQDRFTVTLRSPSGEKIGPIGPAQFVENRQLADKSFASIYNELYHPANGCNCISLYLSPMLREPTPVGVQAGCWLVRLEGEDVRAGEYHGWIERDDPRPVGRMGDNRAAWVFPSFFSQQSNVDNHSVNSLACGRWVIGVANLNETRECIDKTSSQGPTRDQRCKPDIAAPGAGIVAAKGFAGPEDLWLEMSGTSMASPYVAGVAGLMLAAQPNLTAAQILGIIYRTGQPLPGGDYLWSNAAGFGRIKPEKCVEEAAKINVKEDLTG